MNRIDGPDRSPAIVKYAPDTGQRSAMAESLLDALERSLRIFEKHRERIFAQGGLLITYGGASMHSIISAGIARARSRCSAPTRPEIRKTQEIAGTETE